jgi:hypothetical protein
MEQVVTKLMSEVASPKEGASKVPGVTGESSFEKLLENQMNAESSDAKMIQDLMGSSEEGSKLKVMSGDSVPIDFSQIRTEGQRTDLGHLLNEVNRSALQMDQMIEMVSTGQSFSPQELLAIQAGVYQIVQEVDLTGQIVASADRARNSLLNIQI